MKLVNLRFFNFLYDEKLIISEAEFIEYSHKKTVFRDVYLFLQRVNDITVN